jgi:hypothetical protein
MIYTPGLAQHTDRDRFNDTIGTAEEGTCLEIGVAASSGTSSQARIPRKRGPV